MDVNAARGLYLDLMERALLGTIYEDVSQDPWTGGKFNPELRKTGRDWPSQAHSMIGGARMRNLRVLAEDLIKRGVAGDFIETGVWRGGACIMMRAVMAAHGDTSRTVWVCDSFEGLPPPDPANYPADAGDDHSTYKQLAISQEDVATNFRRYNLLDNRVRFLKGWFKDTLPTAPIDKLALLRLDGDMYESTIQGLDALYPKLQPGGYCIVDDYGAVPGCRKAVADYFAKHGGPNIQATQIDWTGVFWKKG